MNATTNNLATLKTGNLSVSPDGQLEYQKHDGPLTFAATVEYRSETLANVDRLRTILSACHFQRILITHLPRHLGYYGEPRDERHTPLRSTVAWTERAVSLAHRLEDTGIFGDAPCIELSGVFYNPTELYAMRKLGAGYDWEKCLNGLLKKSGIDHANFYVESFYLPRRMDTTRALSNMYVEYVDLNQDPEDGVVLWDRRPDVYTTLLSTLAELLRKNGMDDYQPFLGEEEDGNGDVSVRTHGKLDGLWN